jgi:Leucine-rich repeat (LRR) protein
MILATTTGNRRSRGKKDDQSVAASSKALNRTWLGMTIVQSRLLLLSIAGMLGATYPIFKWYNSFQAFHDRHPVVSVLIVGFAPSYIILYIVVPQAWRRYRKARRDAITLVENPDADRIKYFRLDPYIPATPQEFRREDDAQNDVLRWIRETTRPVLFLSGVSGCGKSSVLEAYVLPMLRADGWRVELIRSFGDPLPRLEAALPSRRANKSRVLIVFDQFEEFLVLEDRTSAEERRQFLDRVRELRQKPPPGLCLLFSFRRDYMNDVIAMKLDDLFPGQTFTEIDAFRRTAARRFLEASPVGPGPDLVNRLLAGAEALDDVPARFRPVTLNMLGLALQDFDREVKGQPERLIQSFMEAAVCQAEIKEIAPQVIAKMITDANTKEPRTVAELVSETGLGDQDVTACLILLAHRGLVRRLDAAQNLWEISHDFVARQFALLLGRLRPSVWPAVATFAAPVLFVLILFGFVTWIPIHVRDQAHETMIRLDVRLGEDRNHNLSAEFPNSATDGDLASALPDLKLLGVTSLFLNATNVTALPPLQGLTALQTLNLAGTKVMTLPPLQGLTALQTLNLSYAEVTALPPLQGLTALQTLNLTGTKVTALPALQGLRALQTLDLAGTKVTTLPPLQGLTALRYLDLSGTKVTVLPPLQGLTALQKLDLNFTEVTTLPPLQGLSALRYLDLSGTKVTVLPPLQGLTALQELNLAGAKVKALPPLQGLTALQTLSLSYTEVTTLPPLQGLTALQELDLINTKLTALPPLQGLTALETLNLAGTKVTALPPLQGLTALQVLDLGNTKLTTLPPLQGLTALQILNLTGTKVTTLPPLQGLTALQTLNLTGTKVTTLPPLQGLTALQTLNLSYTEVTALPPLQGLTALQTLNLNFTKVTGLPALQGLTTLQTLNLAGTKVTTLPPLQGLTALQTLNLAGTKVTTLPPLQGLTALQVLDLSNTKVTTLPPLQGLTALHILNLAGTKVTMDDPALKPLLERGVLISQ